MPRAHIALFALPLLALGCPSDEGPAERPVEITVEQLPGGAQRLRVTALLEDRMIVTDQEVSGDLGRFSLSLPRDAGTGKLVVDVGAARADRCVIARGRGDITVAREHRLALGVRLAGVTPPDCGPASGARYRLAVTRTGAGGGEITSSPPGIRCGAECTAEFAPGTWVTLSGLPDGSSHLARWSGGCLGRRSCTVPILGNTSVGARFNRLGCSAGDFCWQSPSPQGNVLHRVHGTGPGDVWIVGEYGTILHHDGTRLTLVDSGTTAHLYGVFAAGPKDVWAVGDGETVLHYDGTRFAQVQLPFRSFVDFVAVWASGPGDVWIAGGAGKVLHFDGKAWAEAPVATTASLQAIWGTGPKDVIIVGGRRLSPSATRGTILQFDGTSWAQRTIDGAFFTDVWGTSGREIFAAGEATYRYDGAGWSKVTTQIPVLSIFGNGAGQVLGAGLSGITSYQGGQFTGAGGQSPAGLRAIWASGPRDLWAAGDQGEILRSDGAAWTSAVSGILSGQGGPIWGSGPNDVYVAGNRILRYDGVRWATEYTPMEEQITAIGGTSGDVWAVGDAGTVLRRKGTWATVSTMGPPMYAVWAISATDVWFGGNDLIARSTGMAPSPMNPGFRTGAIQSIWGTAADLWFGGELDGELQIIRFKGGTWSRPSFPETAYGPVTLWGSGSNEVYVGTGSGLFRWNGTAYEKVRDDIVGTLWGSGPGDLWATVYGGTVLHLSGGTWTTHDLGTRSSGWLWGSGSGQLLVLTNANGILRYQP